MKATQAFIESLLAEGVEVIFGYPGGAVLPIYDALYDAKIRHVLVRHEQGAAHMADGYARATGKPGVVLATSGPGATNLVTGLATAWMDSIPLVAFTGNVARSAIGTDAFQEADITGITLPITKHNFLVRRAEDLPRVIKEAFHIATTGRPGPVLVDLPKDVTTEEINFSYPETVDLPGYRPTIKGHVKQILEAARAIAAAKRPVLYIGGGVIASGAHKEVLALAEKASLPTTFTLMGIGGFPGDHPLSLGMLGMHGTVYANYAVNECDLLIAVGARFDDRVTGDLRRFAPHAKVIHIDIDPAEIGKNVQADIPIVGDAKAVLSVLVEKVREKREQEWLDTIEAWKREYPLTYEEKPGVIAPQRVIQEIYEVTRGEAICTADVGQHQMWLAQYYIFREPRRHISSGGLGSMGFGFPAAIGAALGRPDLQVWSITGDGGFQMTAQELATVRKYNLPVKIAIINNGYLGMVRQWQELLYQRRYSHSDLHDNPDFVKLAEAYGIPGFRCTRPEELRPLLEKAAAMDGPVLLDIHVDQEANVFPMIPAGQSVAEMIGKKGRLGT
ncbi:MAG: acetolactate synthase, large subunit, biosynthetic type [Firmicutes bacterium]|nr:acetolactate synthase, large subunit, biosynthetic type [Bacillota bacterium]MBO2520998.1 acetolactate synthase, large subunit, biosynthetic type [Bacillota bacterium]